MLSHGRETTGRGPAFLQDRMLKKAVQQGRSERRGETYFLYVEPMNDVRTPLADFFSILLMIFGVDAGLRQEGGQA
jgi:hypothetical protein